MKNLSLLSSKMFECRLSWCVSYFRLSSLTDSVYCSFLLSYHWQGWLIRIVKRVRVQNIMLVYITSLFVLFFFFYSSLEAFTMLSYRHNKFANQAYNRDNKTDVCFLLPIYYVCAKWEYYISLSERSYCIIASVHRQECLSVCANLREFLFE